MALRELAWSTTRCRSELIPTYGLPTGYGVTAEIPKQPGLFYIDNLQNEPTGSKFAYNPGIGKS